MALVSPGLPQVETSGLSDCLDRLAATAGKHAPLSTYRLQFNHMFRFADAIQLVPYLRGLGISHLYSSPILRSREGSMHGYDIIDHNAIDPEIGTEEEFRELVRVLRRHGMGLVLDIVPNHMGVGHGTNPWWQDLLENGRSSRYAEYFDVDWEPLKNDLRGKVLIPVLGKQYGTELDEGHLSLQYEDGSFYASYYDRRLPIDPQTVPHVFEEAGDLLPRHLPGEVANQDVAELEQIIAELRALPKHDSSDPEEAAERRRKIPRLKRRLAALTARSSEARRIVEETVKRANGAPGNKHSFDTLHRLLDAQAYRVAHWKVSAEEINYRRFFDINELIGLRMENPDVFAATHRLIRRLLAEGMIDGIRLDHPDGLFNPVQYLVRLQTLYAASQCCGPQPRGGVAENGIEKDLQMIFGQHEWMHHRPPLFVLLEKILEPGEELRQSWPVAGTVGYEFGSSLNRLFIEERNLRGFTNLYHRFIGGPVDVAQLIYSSKRLIMKSSLGSEVTVLSHALDEICSVDRQARDFTRQMLTDAIRETLACFPVYRTYIDQRGNISDSDRAYINEAISLAKRRNESVAAAVFDFLRDILLLKTTPGAFNYENYRKRLRFTLKFQQLTGPVMAKGLEDTACYVYNRFVSVNEVGSSPQLFGIGVEEFHAGNLKRARDWPNSMLNTSTHDSKRSEDVRARLNVLSEMPKQWSAQVMRWRRANRARKKQLGDGRSVPDANEEYLLYQTLVGTWPFAMDSEEERREYIRRIQQYMTKAVHEAKVSLSWTNPNPEYVAALEQFVERILTPGSRSRPNTFVSQVEGFIPTVAFFGAINSLAQVVLKLTSPGAPDIYQGNELWDFSLVDPDNRRAIDFERRVRLLQELEQCEQEGCDQTQLCRELLNNYSDGQVKLWTTMRALRFRRENPELLQQGSYVPLSVSGGQSRHVVAFTRQHEWRLALVAVPRFSYALTRGERRWAASGDWGDTAVILPPTATGALWNVFTGEKVEPSGRAVLCRELFRSFPVALLVSR